MKHITSNRQNQGRKNSKYTEQSKCIEICERKDTDIYKEEFIRRAADFLIETLKSRRTWNNAFEGQPTLTYLLRLSTILEGERKTL